MKSKEPQSYLVSAHIPDAREVYLVGEFNNWSTTATPMVRRDNGQWEAPVNCRSLLQDVCYFVWCQGARFGEARRMRDSATRVVPATALE